jgi:hypothetical protein
MTLPGLGAMILLALLVVYALAVDLALLLKGFRFRALVIVNTIIVLAWATGLAVGRADLAALLENIAWEWEATLLGVAIAALAAVLLLAPLLQHVELRRGSSRRAAYAAIALQCVLAAAWLAGDYVRDHPSEGTLAERKSLRARGEAVERGGMTALREDFEKRHRWGSMESLQLLKGVDSSPLIHGGPALIREDRSALTQMQEKDRAGVRKRLAGAHYYPFIDAKLLWDSLEAGSVERSIPRGTVLPHEPLLEFIDRYGAPKLCRDNRLAEADRAALTRALTASRGPDVVDKVTRALGRVDAACAGAPR